MRRSLVEISGVKLEAAITSRGMSMTYVSDELGYSKWFLTNCKSRNTINKQAIVGLQSRFGIPFEEYKPDEKPEIVKALEEPVKEPIPINIETVDYERLWKLIYTAVKKAMQEALSGTENE